MIKKFTARIKERGNNHVLTPSYFGYEFTTREFLEDFWGLHNDDVEWYEIEEEILEE